MNQKLIYKDENGKEHEVQKNFAGQYEREAYSAPRVIICVFTFLAVVGFLQEKSVNNYLIIALAILLVIVLRQLVLKVVVKDEEVIRKK